MTLNSEISKDNAFYVIFFVGNYNTMFTMIFPPDSNFIVTLAIISRSIFLNALSI